MSRPGTVSSMNVTALPWCRQPSFDQGEDAAMWPRVRDWVRTRLNEPAYSATLMPLEQPSQPQTRKGPLTFSQRWHRRRVIPHGAPAWRRIRRCLRRCVAGSSVYGEALSPARRERTGAMLSVLRCWTSHVVIVYATASPVRHTSKIQRVIKQSCLMRLAITAQQFGLGKAVSLS